MQRNEKKYAQYGLLILCLVALFNYIDRQILTILLDSVKKEFGVQDAAMGFLTGTTFALFYAASSYPVSWAADHGTRRNVLAWAVGAWSLLTTLCGFAGNYAQLAMARAGVACAEAAAVPVSHALLSDFFPPARRATIFAILMAAGSMGIAAGLFFGGWLNDHYGWRAAYMVVGAPGLVVALLLRFTTVEPVRSSELATETSDTRRLIASPLYRGIVLMSAIGGLVTYSLLAWSPTFLIRIHKLSAAKVGLLLGVTTALGHTLGHLAAGSIGDRLARLGRHWYALVAGIGSLCAVPFGFAFLLFQSLPLVIMSFFGLIFFVSAWLTPNYALAFRIAAPSDRARASSIMTVSMVLIGLGLGPLAIGSLTDHLSVEYGRAAIRYSMMAIVAMTAVLGLGFFWVARLALERSALAETERSTVQDVSGLAVKKQVL